MKDKDKEKKMFTVFPRKAPASALAPSSSDSSPPEIECG